MTDHADWAGVAYNRSGTNLVSTFIGIRRDRFALTHAIRLIVKARHRAFERWLPREIIDIERHRSLSILYQIWI